MKKKIFLSLTAIAIVFTSLFSFTACNKSKVKITKNMKPEKLYEMLVNADIKSYTVEISSEGYSITLQYTPDGYLSAEKEGDNPAEERIFTKDASRDTRILSTPSSMRCRIFRLKIKADRRRSNHRSGIRRPIS